MQPFDRTAASATLKDLGEEKLLQALKKWLEGITPPTPAGMGDDCAVVCPSLNAKQLMTVDSVTFGKHFDTTVTAAQAGSKLVKRNLSDIAAMGGAPKCGLLNLLSGPDLSVNWLEEFIHGLRLECVRNGVEIIGGDVSSIDSGQFSASLTLIGECQLKPKQRKTGSSGDWIYVSGSLGGSILSKHHKFIPRLAEGQWLAQREECTSMMDLTDGLGKDLPSLLPDSLSAAIRTSAIPVSNDAHQLSKHSKKDALERAFTDGEDYELLFTVSGETSAEDFEADWNKAFPSLTVTRIGRIIDHAGCALMDEDTGNSLELGSGFEHFLES